jgi:hypothetical protein
MTKTPFQVIIIFAAQADQVNFALTVNSEKKKTLSLDKSLDDALSEDPLTLTLLFVLAEHEAIKSITGEGIKLLFETIKGIFSKKKQKDVVKEKDIKVKTIPVEIRIDNRIFRFIYEVESGNYTVQELK